LELTGVGIAIALANIRRKTGKEFDLPIGWAEASESWVPSDSCCPNGTFESERKSPYRNVGAFARIIGDSYEDTLVGSIALHPIFSPGLENHAGTISDLHM
jgi:hypothetical protein